MYALYKIKLQVLALLFAVWIVLIRTRRRVEVKIRLRVIPLIHRQICGFLGKIFHRVGNIVAYGLELYWWILVECFGHECLLKQQKIFTDFLDRFTIRGLRRCDVHIYGDHLCNNFTNEGRYCREHEKIRQASWRRYHFVKEFKTLVPKNLPVEKLVPQQTAAIDCELASRESYEKKFQLAPDFGHESWKDDLRALRNRLSCDNEAVVRSGMLQIGCGGVKLPVQHVAPPVQPAVSNMPEWHDYYYRGDEEVMRVLHLDPVRYPPSRAKPEPEPSVPFTRTAFNQAYFVHEVVYSHTYRDELNIVDKFCLRKYQDTLY